jgi:hypothetical protein
MSDIGTALRLEQFSKRYTGMLTVDFYVRAIPPPHSPAPIPALAVSDAAGAKANFCRNP